jgi:ubiquinone/menaquinone biosynthesis C-methylase UbiE
MSEDQAQKILQQWQESALFWEKHSDVVRAMFAPITDAMAEAARITEGQSVLDVAGGVGEPTFTIAKMVGDSGSVTFTDAVEGMISAARREARRHELHKIRFCQCVADSLPFQSDSFEAVTCRLGVMLFHEPQAAMREMLRVARPVGRVSLAVWGPSAKNAFFKVVADVVSRYVQSPPEDPDAPGAFRFAERGKLAAMFESAGAHQVSEKLLEFFIEAPLTPCQFWQVRSELSDTLRGKLATLSSEELRGLANEVEEAARAFFIGGRMRFPAQVLIVTGKKSS